MCTLYLIFIQSLEEGTIIIPILQMRKVMVTQSGFEGSLALNHYTALPFNSIFLFICLFFLFLIPNGFLTATHNWIKPFSVGILIKCLYNFNINYVNYGRWCTKNRALYCLIVTVEFDILLFSGMKICVNHFVLFFFFKRDSNTFFCLFLSLPFGMWDVVSPIRDQTSPLHWELKS